MMIVSLGRNAVITVALKDALIQVLIRLAPVSCIVDVSPLLSSVSST